MGWKTGAQSIQSSSHTQEKTCREDEVLPEDAKMRRHEEMWHAKGPVVEVQLNTSHREVREVSSGAEMP